MTHDPFGRLTDRRVVVTGASSGIGWAIAEELVRAGAGHIVIHCARSKERAGQLAAQLTACGATVEVLLADFQDPQQTLQFAEQAWNRWGGVDVWVNNAGVDLLTGGGRDLPYEEKLEALFAIDVRATAMLSRFIGERMRQQGRGVLLSIGWDQADRGMEGDSGELFSAAKNAIMGLTRSLALSLAPEVRVNCIAPGWIRTAWGETASDKWQRRVLQETPLNRWGEPRDIARMARFLVSPDADYITGQVINVNGGAVR